MLQSIEERLATLETSIHSLRSEATFLRHVVTGQVNDQKILKAEVLKRMGVVTQSCEWIENQLDSVLDKRGITVQTNVKQSLLSCPKGCTSSALSEERSYCLEKKRKGPHQDSITRKTCTKIEVRTKQVYVEKWMDKSCASASLV